MKCKSCDRMLSDTDNVTLCNQCLKVSIGTCLEVDLNLEADETLKDQLTFFTDDISEEDYLLMD